MKKKKNTPKKSIQANKIRFHFKAEGTKEAKKRRKLKSADSGKFPSFFSSENFPSFWRKAMVPSGLKLHGMIFHVGRLSCSRNTRKQRREKKKLSFDIV